MKSKPNTLTVDVYRVLAEAVELGVQTGWRRAHKHTDHPAAETLQQAITDAVLLECSERFIFPDVGDV